MAQYTDGWNDSLPSLGDTGNEWPLDYNGNIERNSRAIPSLVTLRLVDGTAYAIADGDVLASGTNHASVIQSAIDWAYDNKTSPDADLEAQQMAGWIDGSGESYIVESEIHLKPELGLKNITLDANGADLGGNPILRVATGSRHNLSWNQYLMTVGVRNNGNGPGAVFTELRYAAAVNVIAYNNSADGLVCEGGIGYQFKNCTGGHNGRRGMFITDTSATEGNLVRVYDGDYRYNQEEGIRMEMTDQPGQTSDQNGVIGAEFHHNYESTSSTDEGLYVGNGFRTTEVRRCWLEANYLRVGGSSSNTNTAENQIIHNKSPRIAVSEAHDTTVEHNFNNGGGLDIDVNSTATDTKLKNNVYGSGSLDGKPSATRLVENGVSLNDGDPSSTGQWNGHGWNGLVVYDTSVARPYDAYRYVSGQWQSA